MEFLAGTVVVGTALNAPYSASWTPAAAGIVALTARVTDSVGTIVTSGIVNVNVTAPSVAITSPATGSKKSHDLEQNELLGAAFTS